MSDHQKKASTVIGIDVGGSTTKIVGFRNTGNTSELIQPEFVRAADPVTSIYGAFGKFTFQNGLELSDIDRVMMTGVGAAYLNKPIYSLDCRRVPEFDCVGAGGLYLSGLDEAIIVSMGTGTALIHAKKLPNGKTEAKYLGGTGVGGGTLLGLTRRLTGVDSVEHIEQLCRGGNLDNIDLRIKDITHSESYSGMNQNLTAANFGKVSDLATNSDLALGVANMVAETIAMISVFAARGFGVPDIVLTGNLTTIPSIRSVFEGLGQGFGVRFFIPENSQFSTVIGAALHEEEN